MDSPAARLPDVAAKIARLVEERGWNQEDFARIADLNRHTVREILKSGGARRLRNATVKQCAEALGLEVNELRDLPLERLLPRMHSQFRPSQPHEGMTLLQSGATLPELVGWLQAQAERAAQMTVEEAQELLTLQGNGTLGRLGVDHFIELIERKRRLMQQVAVIATTEYLCLLEQIVGLVHDKVKPLKQR